MNIFGSKLIIIWFNLFVILFGYAINAATVTNTSTTAIQGNITKTSVLANATKIVTAKSQSNQSVGKNQSSSRNSIQSNVKQTATKQKLTTDKKIPNPDGTSDNDAYKCPGPDKHEFQLFPVLCTRHGECIRNIGNDYRCCKQFANRRCVQAEAKPIPEQMHQPLLWVIPRKCPREPLAELFWQVQTCNNDRDCWPRICCPDGVKKYCRTSRPELERLQNPIVRQLSYPLQSISGYIQCTPPPPPAYDKFPKKCNNTLDCFPNVCCQEAGKKHCRPPRRSLLALVTGVAQRFNTGFIRSWTQNLVIK